MSTTFHRDPQTAFTLIELLVSVAVGSYLISMAAVCISMSLKASKNANTVAAQAKAGSNMMEWLWSNRTTSQWTVNTSLNGISAFRTAAQQIKFATGNVYGITYNNDNCSFYHQSAIAAVPTYKISSVESFSGSLEIDPGRVVNAQEDTPFQDGQYVFIYSAGTSPYQLFTPLPSPTSLAPKNKTRINARTTRICDNTTVPAWPDYVAGATWRIGYATHFPLPVPSITVQRP